VGGGDGHRSPCDERECKHYSSNHDTPMSHGFIYRKPEKEDYKDDGKIKLGGLPIVPSGQWDAFLPEPEFQDRYCSTMSCASFNTLKAIQALHKQEFGDTTNWSDRMLASLSGTTPSGNDPHTVAETLRKKGTVYETEWPYTSEINTIGKYLQTPPFQTVVNGQVEFKGVYDFAHQYVGTDPQSMKTALTYSPLGVDVFAWNTSDTDDIYHRNGMQSEHWTMIYGYVPGKYWKCLDSYPPYQKKLAWDFGFTMVKQYTLHKAVLDNSLWAQAIRWLRQFIPNLAQ
jgi:hypothetical protein